MSKPSSRSEAKTTDHLETARSRPAMSSTSAPPTSISLDTGRNSRPRAKVNQALAIAASINSESESKSAASMSLTSGTSAAAFSARGGGRRTGGGESGANSQSQSQGTSGASAEDYDASKAADRGGRAARDAAAEERRMVADLDRFHANDENDNLDDSF